MYIESIGCRQPGNRRRWILEGIGSMQDGSVCQRPAFHCLALEIPQNWCKFWRVGEIPDISKLVFGSFSEGWMMRSRRIYRATLGQNAYLHSLFENALGARSKDLVGGMLSLEEIKKWAETIEAQSTSNLTKLCLKPARPSHRAVIEVVFADGVNEYRVWISRELNIIYVDDFHEGVESDAKLFRGPLTRHSLESISSILRHSV